MLFRDGTVYAGDILAKKVFTNNTVINAPNNFTFATFLTSPPLLIRAANAGASAVSSRNFYLGSGVTFPTWISTPRLLPFGSYDAISVNLGLSGWKIEVGMTTYYQVTGVGPILSTSIPPATGWYSTNSSYDPPPTLTFNDDVSLTYTRFIQAGFGGTFTSNLHPLVVTTDYTYNSAAATFIGVKSSTNFANVTGINAGDFITSIDLDYFPNIENFTSRSPILSVNLNSFKKLKSVSISDTLDSLNVYNNLSLTSLGVQRPPKSFKLQNNPNIKSLVLFSINAFLNTDEYNLTSLDLTEYKNLQQVIIYSSNIQNITTLSAYPDLNSASLVFSSLTGSDLLDTVYASLCDKATFSLIYNDDNLNYGRSNKTNNAWLHLYKTANGSNLNGEIDPMYPKSSIPTTYHPFTLGNSITVVAPISTNPNGLVVNGWPQAIQSTTLSGIYTKVENLTYNNRDVFRNSNDFYIKYDQDNSRWTLVGPTSTSETIWLSSRQSLAGDYGNIPGTGWGGLAFNSGQFLGSNPPGGWAERTSVFSTQMLLFSSFIYSGAYGSSSSIRTGVFPLSGYNSDFYWSDYNFSGIGYQNVSDPTWNGRWTLISPVHYINAQHFPDSLSIGSKINFIHKDGSISTRTVLSAVNNIGGTSTDVRLGIFDAPLSAAAYPIGSLQNLIQAITAPTDFKNFLYGPHGYGRVGICLPRSLNNAINYSPRTNYYAQISSIPQSLWFDSSVIVGDSSTQFWYADPITKQLVLLGLTQTAGPGGARVLNSVYSSMYNTATALCQQFYGNPLMYQLTAYNF